MRFDFWNIVKISVENSEKINCIWDKAQNIVNKFNTFN